MKVTSTRNSCVTQNCPNSPDERRRTPRRSGVAPLGSLSYSYDALGRRTSVSGSLAQYYSIPDVSVSAATYDPANELTTWAGIAISTDANGNITSNPGYGNNGQYSWDARNHLVSIGTNVAIFTYDAFGRRVSKSVAGVPTNFLYDGITPIQEQSGTSPSANLLAGGNDEYFARTDSTGTHSYVRDALGSTLWLADGNGVPQTWYGYLPFGGTLSQGNTSANSFQYTGRENDGIGLYYNRARYYDPQLQRFVSEDPIGLNGGPNFYAYAGNGPTNFSDISGLCPLCFVMEGAEIGSIGGPVGTAVGAAIGLGLGFAGAYYYDQAFPDAGGEQTAASAQAEPTSTPMDPGRAPSGYSNPCAPQGLDPNDTWGNPNTLAKHFADHGADFGAASPNEYAQMASDFLSYSQSAGLPTKIGVDGAIRTYDPATNTFGAYNADGSTKTFFKPTPKDYFDRQPGTPCQ